MIDSKVINVTYAKVMKFITGAQKGNGSPSANV